MSGKLPNGGCENVQVMDDEGHIDVRSMVYTDYFVKGTQPTTLCPLHPSGGFADAVAGALGVQIGHPVSTDQAGVPAPPPTSTAGAAPPATGEQVSGGTASSEDAKKKKKRGFWSRLFGGGGDKEDKKEKKPGG
jgi:hypothetical protein